MRPPIKAMVLGLLFVVVSLQPAKAQPSGPPAPPMPPPPPGPPLEVPPPGAVVEQEAFPLSGVMCDLPRWKLLAGAGFDIVGPFEENNRAFTVFINKGDGSTQSTGFGDPFTVASRFWLGLAGPGGWGFRTSLWNFNQEQHLTAALDGSAPHGSVIFSASPLGVGVETGTVLLAPGNADIMNAAQRLTVTVLDFEATREIEAGNVFLLLSAGCRLARISQHYNVDVLNTANDFTADAETIQLRSGQRFIGAGPTVALQAWYPIVGGFSLYGTVRGSFLFGDFHQFANTSTVRAVDGTITETLGDNASFCHGAAVPMGELELGVQWSGEWGRFHPFVRTGVEAKTFFNALSGSTVQEVNGDSASLNSNLSFFGVTFMAGVNY